METNIPRKGIAGPQFQLPHSFVCERFIYSHDRSAYSAAGNMWADPGNIKIAHRHMKVEIGTGAEQCPQKEIHYINRIFIAVRLGTEMSLVFFYCVNNTNIHLDRFRWEPQNWPGCQSPLTGGDSGDPPGSAGGRQSPSRMRRWPSGHPPTWYDWKRPSRNSSNKIWKKIKINIFNILQFTEKIPIRKTRIKLIPNLCFWSFVLASLSKQWASV